MLVWVIYDISSTPRRTKVAKACKDAGLYRVQLSAFLGDLNMNRIDELKIQCADLVDKKTDSVYIFPMCEDDFKKARLIGHSFDKKLISGELLTKFL